MSTRKQWFVIASIVLVMILLLGIGLALHHQSALRRLDEYSAEFTRTIAEIRAQDHKRPPLFEPAIDGNAWDFYRPALQSIETLPAAETNLFPTLNGKPSFVPDWEKLAMLAEKYDPLFRQLREGLRCTHADPRYPYEKGIGMKIPEAMQTLKAAKLMRDVAECRHRQGRDRDALELSLIALGVFRDVGKQGVLVHRLVQVVSENLITSGIRKHMEDHSFSESDLRWFGEKLDLLGSPSFPIGELTRIEFLTTGITIAESRGQGLVPDTLKEFSLNGFSPKEFSPADTYRYGFSTAAMAVNALETYDSIIKGFDGDSQHSQKEREANLARRIEEAALGPNEILKFVLPATRSALTQLRQSHMKWDLTRIAVALALYESVEGKFPRALKDLVPGYLPELKEDPTCGLPFFYRNDGGSAIVYAAGGDGDDDGGRPVPDDDFKKDGDIVCTVKRK